MQIDLSPTEERILEMIVGNMSANEIAFALDVEKTVVDEVSKRIFKKLGVGDTKSASEIAAKHRLVRLEP